MNIDKEKLKVVYKEFLNAPNKTTYLVDKLKSKQINMAEFMAIVNFFTLAHKEDFAPQPLPPKPAVVEEYEKRKAKVQYQYEQELLDEFYQTHPLIREYYTNCRILKYENKAKEDALKEAEKYRELYEEIKKEVV